MDCRPVQWVYVLDSGQRSSVTVKPHHPAALRSVRTTTEGGSNPPVFPVTRADVYARTPIARIASYILYTPAWIYTVYREICNVRVGINKAPYCVNYGSSGVSALPVRGLKVASSAVRGSLTRAPPPPAHFECYFSPFRLHHASSSTNVRASNRTNFDTRD